MSGLRKWLLVSMLGLGACAPALQRDLVYKPIYIPQTDTLWLIEKERSGASAAAVESISIILCHRDATPACVRVRPLEPRTRSEYTRWHSSLSSPPRQPDRAASV